MTFLSNLSLFIRAIAKVLLMTGLGLGGALALVAELYGVRIVELGFEQVRGGQLAMQKRLSAFTSFRRPATSLPRKESRRAA